MMIVYWAFCYFSVFLSWFFGKIKSNHKNKREIVCFIAALPLALLSAFRYNVGTDYASYFNSFLRIIQGDDQKLEPLFLLVNKGVIWLHGDFQWVVALCSIIFIFFIFSEIYRSSPIVPLSIFLLVGSLHYFYSLTNIRQMIGCSILFFSIRYIEKMEWKKFLLCILIATGFHYACIIFLIAYWLKDIKISKTKMFAIGFIIFITRSLIAQLGRFLIGYTKYASYLGSKWDVDEVSYSTIAVQLAILVLAVLNEKSKDENIKFKLLMNIQFVSFLTSLLSGLLPQVYRIQRIFGISSIVLIALSVKKIRNKYVRLVVIFAIVILFSVYAYVSASVHDQFKIIPYRSVFSL